MFNVLKDKLEGLASRLAVMELQSLDDRIGFDPLEIQIEVNRPDEGIPDDVDNYFEFEERKSP